MNSIGTRRPVIPLLTHVDNLGDLNLDMTTQEQSLEMIANDTSLIKSDVDTINTKAGQSAQNTKFILQETQTIHARTTDISNSVGTAADESTANTVIGLLKKIDSLLPITPGGGDDGPKVEYVYLGCSSSTDISSAKMKYKLSTPSAGGTSFKSLYDLQNNSFGSIGYEFVFTRAGVFFISGPLSSPDRIKVHSLDAYRTGGLSVNDIIQHIIFCDKDNNILLTEERTNIVGNNAPVFWPINTNIPIS